MSSSHALVKSSNRKSLYLVIIAGIPALRGLVVAVATVGELKLLALAPQRVDTALQINVEPRAVVDRQGLLRRYILVRKIQRILQAFLVDFQEAREVERRLRNRNIVHQGAVHAILRAANRGNRTDVNARILTACREFMGFMTIVLTQRQSYGASFMCPT